MDKEMAIETLQEMKGVFGGRGHEQYALLALDLAIDALEKPLEKQITNKQAIKILSSQLMLTLEPYLDEDGVFVGGTVVVKEDMKMMETCEVIIEALEKQSPKKPMLMQMAEPEYMCECGTKYYYWGDKIPTDYCGKCGQKLDWSVRK